MGYLLRKQAAVIERLSHYLENPEKEGRNESREKDIMYAEKIDKLQEYLDRQIRRAQAAREATPAAVPDETPDEDDPTMPTLTSDEDKADQMTPAMRPYLRSSTPPNGYRSSLGAAGATTSPFRTPYKPPSGARPTLQTPVTGGTPPLVGQTPSREWPTETERTTHDAIKDQQSYTKIRNEIQKQTQEAAQLNGKQWTGAPDGELEVREAMRILLGVYMADRACVNALESLMLGPGHLWLARLRRDALKSCCVPTLQSQMEAELPRTASGEETVDWILLRTTGKNQRTLTTWMPALLNLDAAHMHFSTIFDLFGGISGYLGYPLPAQHEDAMVLGEHQEWLAEAFRFALYRFTPSCFVYVTEMEVQYRAQQNQLLQANLSLGHCNRWAVFRQLLAQFQELPNRAQFQERARSAKWTSDLIVVPQELMQRSPVAVYVTTQREGYKGPRPIMETQEWVPGEDTPRPARVCWKCGKEECPDGRVWGAACPDAKDDWEPIFAFIDSPVVFQSGAPETCGIEDFVKRVPPAQQSLLRKRLTALRGTAGWEFVGG
jgi:hypothetical protein